MDSIIPSQEKGNEVNVEHALTVSSEKIAKAIFGVCADRLLNVNQWHILAGPMSATFQLTDQTGKEIQREAREGDYFKINIPGPGSSAGEGYDWVQIERLALEAEASHVEQVVMRVRPVRSPFHPAEGTAHFFTEEATSTFSVSRKGLIITAGVYGRNEVANTDASQPIDKIRNVAVAAGARLGASRIQWENLVQGILGVYNENTKALTGNHNN